ncbi:MAG: DUF4838 domain-containing protein [Planctomycetota bacterium]
MRYRLLTALWMVACTAPGLRAATLVREGKAAAAVVLPVEPEPDERLAAEELIEHVLKISGAKLATVPPGKVPQGLLPIRLGGAADPRLDALVREQGADPASFALVVTPEGVAVRGLSAEGTLFGVYELLEQLGVRWFMPGEFGTVLPNAKTLTVEAQRTVQVPSFKSRHLQTVSQRDKWYRRVRLGGPRFPGCHGIKIGKASVKDEPELFALHNGTRHRRQLCVSNPEVLRRAIETTRAYFRKHPDHPWIGMGPGDGGGFCQCPRCQALDAGDYDPLYNAVSVTDRYVGFFNRVLEGIADEFPDKKLCFYAYHRYIRPPVRVKPSRRIVPAFAPIGYCRVHGMSNPLCPERAYIRTLVEGWSKLVPEFYERGYYFNLACPGFPFNKIHAIRDEVDVYRRLGVAGWRVETMPHWGSMTPSIYLAARLFWNAEADVDALKQDFYAKFFGPAAEPMGRYVEATIAALRDGNYHTGSSFNMPDFYPPRLRRRLRADLDEAARLAPDGLYADRVAAFRLPFDFLEHFLAMLDHRNAFDFQAAQRDLDALRAVRQKAVAHDPPLLYPRAARSYMRRFWAPCTEQGAERLRRGDLVAGLPDQWAFRIDSTGAGEAFQWWSARLPESDWQRLRTKTASWSDQGLRYYKGLAWYRARVTIPARFRGRKVMLWFGGVDEKAKVWVNDRLLGESFAPGPGLPGVPRAFKPFELNATEALRFGAENVVTVKITNERLNELGTGGITAPVMFYAPAQEANTR